VAVYRYVKQNSQGSWDVLKEGRRRAAIQASSRSAAVTRARAIVSREGGGEVRVLNDVGKIADTKMVPAQRSRRAA
jgi:hypothetical protein